MPGGSFDVDQKELELAALRQEASDPALWNDPKRATAVNRKLARYEQIIDKAKQIAAHQLEASVDDLEFDKGTFTMRGTDKGMPLAAVAFAAPPSHPMITSRAVGPGGAAGRGLSGSVISTSTIGPSSMDASALARRSVATSS